MRFRCLLFSLFSTSHLFPSLFLPPPPPSSPWLLLPLSCSSISSISNSFSVLLPPPSHFHRSYLLKTLPHLEELDDQEPRRTKVAQNCKHEQHLTCSDYIKEWTIPFPDSIPFGSAYPQYVGGCCSTYPPFLQYVGWSLWIMRLVASSLPSPLVPLPFLSPSPAPLWPQRAMFPETIVSSGIYQLCRRQEMEQDKMRSRQLQEMEYVAENYSSPCSLDDTVKINHILTSSVRYCLQVLMKFTLK